MQPELYRVTDFCAAFGISRAKFYIEVKAGRLRTVKLGYSTRVRHSDAIAWIDSYQPTAEAA